MAEFPINPKHNVFKKYRTVNYINSYVFAPPIDLSTNTEIGGIAATISTPALLASKLGISVGTISNFSIVGSDIKCKITGSYGIPISAFNYLGTPSFTYPPCTYYYDKDGLVTSLGEGAFSSYSLKWVYFKNATSVGYRCFADGSGNQRDFVYIPSCTNLGGSVGDDSNFIYGLQTKIIYVNPSLATCNSGAPDGDLAYAITQGATIRYVTNFTVPNPVATLASGTIYNTVIQLNFTTPSSTNTIDYYECYVNGVKKNNITASGQYITGLTPSTSYNFTVVAVDVFYNKSVMSNSVSVSTNTTSAVPTTGLVSYYKLDSNSNDTFGSNNGTDTSVSYIAGKINNAGSYNGSTSKTLVGNPANLQLNTGTISCWIKTSGAGSSYRSVFGKIQAYNMFLVDGVFGIYSWAGVSGFKSTGMSLNDGLWHHLAFVFDSGTSLNYLYVDGVLKLTTSMTVATQSDNVCIGSSNSIQNFNGLIDEANIYNVKLTQNQIQLLYNSGTGTTL
jgi:hypothetical protein